MTAPATCPVCQRTLDAVLQLYDEPAVDPRVAMSVLSIAVRATRSSRRTLAFLPT